jgi:hypothetical protein
LNIFFFCTGVCPLWVILYIFFYFQIASVDNFVSSVNLTLKHRHDQERLASIITKIESYDAVEAPNDEVLKVRLKCRCINKINTNGRCHQIYLYRPISTTTYANQCQSPLKLWVWIPLRWGVLDTTLCDQVCQWLATGRWFPLYTPVSSTNKTDRHDITEILLNVALNTISLTLVCGCWGFQTPTQGWGFHQSVHSI